MFISLCNAIINYKYFNILYNIVNKIINKYIVLTARTPALSFFQNPALDRDSNPHLIFWPSETVKRVRIRFENIR
jgi:hypothetical protein